MRPHLGGGITAAAIRGGICDLFDVGRGRERDAREADDAKTWRGGKEGAPTGAPRPLVWYSTVTAMAMHSVRCSTQEPVA